MPKKRLDELCLEQGIASTLKEAQALIIAGKVTVEGQVSTKPGMVFRDMSTITSVTNPCPYVSRGGLKLQAALEQFHLDVCDRVVIDIGASTGGFTDCVLQRGARHVIAIDAGHGHLDWKLRNDPRVTCLERTNARYLDKTTLRSSIPEDILFPPSMVTIDVSFISLIKIVPAIHQIVGETVPFIVLIKPQFEAKRSEIESGGVVRNAETRRAIVDRVTTWLTNSGHQIIGGIDSPIAGPKGNVEYLCYFLSGKI